MARKHTKTTQADPEAETEVTEDATETEPATDNPEPAAGGRKSKVEAVRIALRQGYDTPEAGLDFIRRRFDIEMTPQHFSSTKSQLRKKARESGSEEVAPARGRRKPLIEGYVAPPPKPPGEPDVLLALESVKGLVEQYGADKIKRIVDLLG